jgi:hypothetical protein
MDGGYPTFVLVAVGAAVLFMVLRRISTLRISAPRNPTHSGKEEASAEPEAEWARGEGSAYELQGEYRGTPYVVTNYDGRHVVVAIELEEVPRVRAEASAQIPMPRIEESALSGEINALFGLGAVYVDVGIGANWVAAEFDGESLSQRLIERAMDHLIRLRDIATGRAV